MKVFYLLQYLLQFEKWYWSSQVGCVILKDCQKKVKVNLIEAPYKIIFGYYLAFIVSYRALCPLPSWVATTSTFLVFAVGRTEHRTSTCKVRVMVIVITIMVILMMVMMVLDDGFGLGWPNSIQLSTKLPRSKFTALASKITICPKNFNSWVWPKLGAHLPNWQVHPSWPVDKKGKVDASCGERFVAQRTRWEWASSNFALWKKYFSHAAQEYFDINCVSDIWKIILCQIFEKYFCAVPILRWFWKFGRGMRVVGW